MAIKTVKVTINGSEYSLTNSSGNTWTGTITAPGATSYNETDHEFPVTVTATNDAGTTASDSSYGLRVKETVAPVITITSPTSGARVVNNKQPIVFTVIDENGGSGVDISSLVVEQDGTAVTSGIVTTAVTNGYSVTYTPTTALSDGEHTVTVNCSDNDGNAAAAKTTTYTVDTVPPTLNVTSPADGLITNNASCVVAGVTNDATSSPVTLTINGTAVTVGSNGAFSKTITLVEGANTITVVATDSAGKSSTVTRNVTLNTSSIVISNISITPNPVDTGETMVVSVTVAED